MNSIACVFAAVEHVIEHNLFVRLGIGTRTGAWIRESWERDDPTLYGRFDLTIGADGQPKMYEYNADTPTSIIEASLAQWFWKEDVRPGDDQFNSLHESLIARRRWLHEHYRAAPLLHFACMYDGQEDVCNTEYLMDTAVQADWSVKLIDVRDIGNDGNGSFVDLQGQPIELMFKLFPWEWMMSSSFGDELLKDRCRWIEPPWKAVLSNKGILPILWECRDFFFWIEILTTRVGLACGRQFRMSSQPSARKHGGSGQGKSWPLTFSVRHN